jgi:prepilin-type N-terminal cleavage/methylation domain-containing protein
MRPNDAGFTLIEVIIVTAVFAILITLGLPVGLDAYRHYLLTSDVRNLISLLRRAENRAFSNDHASPYGVSIQNDRFVLFQGSSYASRKTAFDEEYPKSGAVTASGTTEIVFAALSAKPNASGSIILSNGLRSQTITINEEGTINW